MAKRNGVPTLRAFVARDVRQLMDSGQLVAGMGNMVFRTMLKRLDGRHPVRVKSSDELRQLILDPGANYRWIPQPQWNAEQRRQAQTEERRLRAARAKQQREAAAADQRFEEWMRQREEERRLRAAMEKRREAAWGLVVVSPKKELPRPVVHMSKEDRLRELACPQDPANGDHKAQLELGKLLSSRGDPEGARWLMWAAVEGYHADGYDPYES